MPSVFFYISGHGFGHTVRQNAIINALGKRLPGVDLVISTSAPRRLFDEYLRVPYTFIERPNDTGVVQIDSVRLDAPATIALASEFYRTLGSRAEAEAAELRERDARLVISDAPPLACAAAAVAGVPSVVVANFSWDCIYEGYESELHAAPDLLPMIRDAYSQAREGWRLPLHGGFATVPNVRDLPFVARHARPDRSRDDVRRELSLPRDRPLALVSFGGYGVEGLDMAALSRIDPWGLLMTSTTPMDGRTLGERGRTGSLIPLDEPGMYARGFLYEDIVHAMDVVVSKPGYGIIAECVANQTALLYTSRGHFAEYDVLVAGLPRVLRAGFIDHDALFAGRWLPYLDSLLAQPAPPERPRVDGADVAAALLLDMM